MKSLVFLLLLWLSCPATAQTRRLNQLLKDWAATCSTPVPEVLGTTKEIVVPSVCTNNIKVIKWRDVDSVKIYYRNQLIVDVFIYGKYRKLMKCNPTDLCTIMYFNDPYQIDTSTAPEWSAQKTRIDTATDKIWLPLKTIAKDRNAVLTDTILNKIKRLFYRLNHAPVVEDYPSGKFVPQKIKPSFHLIYLAGGSGEVYTDEVGTLSKRRVRNIKTIKTFQPSLKIVSFLLYKTGSLSSPVSVLNQGEIFNKKLHKIIRKVRKGDVLVFDEIKVSMDGDIRRAPPIVFKVK